MKNIFKDNNTLDGLMDTTLDRDGEVWVMYRILTRIDMTEVGQDTFLRTFKRLRKALRDCTDRRLLSRLVEFTAILCTLYPGKGGSTWSARLMAHDALRDSDLQDGRHFHALTECLLEQYLAADPRRHDKWWFHLGDFESLFRTVSPDHPVARCCSSHDALYHLTDDIIVGRDSDGWLVLMTAIDADGCIQVYDDGTDSSYWQAGDTRILSPIQHFRRIMRILRLVCQETGYVPLPVRMMVVLPDGGTVVSGADTLMQTIWSDLDIELIWHSDKLGTWWMCNRPILPRDNDWFYLLSLVRNINKVDVLTTEISWHTVHPYLSGPF